MVFFHILTMLGGLALFLYGMQVLGDGLEKISGGKMEMFLEKMTASRFRAVLSGAAVTALIQSSSAATVMVVGFVNSGIMKLSQAVGVIMGANIGTTITSWVLSLAGIESGNFFVKLLKPSSFAPVLAVTGVAILLFSKKEKRKNTALALVGFAILMNGMETMTEAVKPLSQTPEFTNLLLAFSHPVAGLIAGVFLTAIVQSSSASVGILQALCATGAVSYETAVPVVMGQNIGTCITALLSSVGASKNAKRAAVVHLYFNLLGTAAFMLLFYFLNSILQFAFLGRPAEAYGIAALHSVFNLFATFLLLPFADRLEALACISVRMDGRESKKQQEEKILDERFLNSPALAMNQCRIVVLHIAEMTNDIYQKAASLLEKYDRAKAKQVGKNKADIAHYSEITNAYLRKLSKEQLLEKDSRTMLLFLECIGDFTRISDHAGNIKDACKKLQEKKKGLPQKAKSELMVVLAKDEKLLELTLAVFKEGEEEKSAQAEKLLPKVSKLCAQIRKTQLERMKKEKCTVEQGFLLNSIVTGCEGVAAHCAHIVASAEVTGFAFR